MSARERVQRLLDGKLTDIEVNAFAAVTDPTAGTTLGDDIRELVETVEAGEIENLDTQPAVMTEAGKLHYLLDRVLTSAAMAEADAEAFRAMFSNIEEVRITTEDSTKDRPEVTRHAIEAAAYHRILDIMNRGRFVHVSTEPA